MNKIITIKSVPIPNRYKGNLIKFQFLLIAWESTNEGIIACAVNNETAAAGANNKQSHKILRAVKRINQSAIFNDPGSIEIDFSFSLIIT